MIYNGITVLLFYLSKTGEDFWTILPIFYCASFIIVLTILYPFSIRGKLTRSYKKLSAVNKQRIKNGLGYLKKEIKVEKVFDKALKCAERNSTGLVAELILIATYFLSSFGILSLSLSVLMFSNVTQEKFTLIFLISTVAISFCAIVMISFSIYMRQTAIKASEFIRNYRFYSITTVCDKQVKPRKVFENS